jgi:hypothetical protein
MSGSIGGTRRRGGLAVTDAGDSGASGVTSINGLSGALTLASPMLAVAPAVADFELDNGNVKVLTDAATIVGIDAVINNSFYVETAAARTFAVPTGAVKDGDKITITIKKTYAGSTHHTFSGAANGYDFASTLITLPGSGPRVAWFNDLFDAMLNGQWIKIGFEWISAYNFWVAVALAGPWPQTPE